MKYDLVVIGSGPGGYVCAIRAAQLGLKVAVVERWATHGGTCLNIGCIPSKALLHCSEVFAHAVDGMSALGVKTEKVSLDLATMMQHKAKVVEANVKGIDFLFRKNGIEAFHGHGSLVGPGRVRVSADDGDTREIEASNIVLATGSRPADLPGIEMDEASVVSSTGALEFAEVPDHLIVVGAGVIGLELGSVWLRLGAKVTVVEYLPRILPGMDGESAKLMQRLLTKQGMKFKLGHAVKSVTANGDGSGSLVVEAAGKGDKIEHMSASKVLVAIGRKPYTDGLGLENAGIDTDGGGRIRVDSRCATNVAGIYAIGDAIAGPMLAHKAEEDGVVAAENIAGKLRHSDHSAVPSVVYTEPEFAAVGATEEELKDNGIEYKVGKFPFSANGRAKAAHHADGQVKLLADATTDRVLGAHIIGHGAGELIQEVVLAMAFKASAEDIALTCHAHPTMSEAVREAAMAVSGGAIHI